MAAQSPCHVVQWPWILYGSRKSRKNSLVESLHALHDHFTPKSSWPWRILQRGNCCFHQEKLCSALVCESIWMPTVDTRTRTSSFCWEAMRKKSFSCLGAQKELELLEQELWKACMLFHLTNEISLVCTGELDSFHHRNLLEGGRYHEILNTVIFITWMNANRRSKHLYFKGSRSREITWMQRILMEQVALGGCGVGILGKSQKPSGHSPEQLALCGPAWEGIGPDDIQRSLPTLTTLWFCDKLHLCQCGEGLRITVRITVFRNRNKPLDMFI